jgi:hypothetical protein
METPEEYYNDPSLHGHYQFTNLRDIVEQLMAERLEPDSYIKNTNRNLFILHAKNGIKELSQEVTAASILSIEMTVGEESFIVLPQNYVSWVSVSVVLVDPNNGKRYLKQLDENNNINTATGYLQDDQAKILFDNDGGILTADASNAYNMPYRSYEFIGNTCSGSNAFFDTAVLSQFGEFKVDINNGKLVLSDNLIDKEIVLEYLSDGLYLDNITESQIKVHKYIEKSVKDYVYSNCIERRQTVPANEKARADMKYKSSRWKSKKALSGLNLRKISREMRSKSKYL